LTDGSFLIVGVIMTLVQRASSVYSKLTS